MLDRMGRWREHARALFNERLRVLKGYPLERGLDYVVIDSNMSDILQLNFEETHTHSKYGTRAVAAEAVRTY